MSLIDLVQRIRPLVPVEDYKVGLNVYLQCFTGKVLFDTIKGQSEGQTSELIEKTCKELIFGAFICPVNVHKPKVFSSTDLYRFAEQTLDESSLPTVVSKLSPAERERRSSAQTGRELFLNTMDEMPASRVFVPWTPAEDQELVLAVSRYGENWTFVSHNVSNGRTEEECENRWVEKLMEARTPISKHKRKGSLFNKIVKPLRHNSSRDLATPPPPTVEQHRENLATDYMKRRDEQQTKLNQAMQEVGSGEAKVRRRANSDDGNTVSELRNFMSERVPEPTRKDIAVASNTAGDRTSLPAWSRPGGAGFSSRAVMNSPVMIKEKVVKPLGPPEVCRSLLLIVMGLSNPPESSRGLRESHYFVRIAYNGKCVSTRPVVKRPKLGITWGELLVLENVELTTVLNIKLLIKHRLVKDEEVGRTELSIGNLAKRPYRNLVLSDSSSRVITDNDELDVTLLKLGVDKSTIPPSWPMPVKSQNLVRRFDKHLMVVTRGTRGDVQPFLALARGLAEKYNWMITICTELRYLPYVKKNAQSLSRGCIRFRISGGDTQKRVESRIAKWAMNLNSKTMQNVMLAFSEAEFFDSEAALFYWAKNLEPDYLMFGFTMASVAMILSEALQIPLLGFLLQPTCIPSSQYPPVVPLDESAYKKMTSMADKKERKHSDFSSLKVMLENNPLYGNLNHMRQKRGLQPMKRYVGRGLLHAFQSNTWTDLQAKGVPLIVPINEYAFGGKPPDWGIRSVFSNYIFLRGKTVPPLDPKLTKFIDIAKSKKHKLIVLAFSSMPVEKDDIFRIAIKIITNCIKEVCVIALIGNRTEDAESDGKVEAEMKRQVERKRLFVAAGAPFGRLFPLLDCAVAHGGLGTTGEAIMSRIPVIITGVLLMDQRFWGTRCHDMEIGPFPVHISKFYKSCVAIIDKALSDDCKWKENAVKIGEILTNSMEDDPSGVNVNCELVHRMAQVAPCFAYVRPSGHARKTSSIFLKAKPAAGDDKSETGDDSSNGGKDILAQICELEKDVV